MISVKIIKILNNNNENINFEIIEEINLIAGGK